MVGKKQDVQEWHGHRIVSGEDIAEFFDDQDDEATIALKRRQRRRRIIIMSVLTLLIAGITWFAFMIIQGQARIPGWDHAELSEIADCPSDTRTYLSPSEVTVNVYNATMQQGFAQQTADAFRTRGFNIGEVDNARLADQSIVVLIVTGEQGFDHAFTVQKHLYGTQVIVDDRRDNSIDVVVNEGHNALKQESKVNSASGILTCMTSTPRND